MTNLLFEPPFGILRGNIQTTKHVADFLFAIIKLFRQLLWLRRHKQIEVMHVGGLTLVSKVMLFKNSI